MTQAIPLSIPSGALSTSSSSLSSSFSSSSICCSWPPPRLPSFLSIFVVLLLSLSLGLSLVLLLQHPHALHQLGQHALGLSGERRVLCRPTSRSGGVTDSFFIRHACEDAFLLIRGQKVLTDNTLRAQNPSVAIEKETCVKGKQELLYVRLRHVQSGQYICFDKRGRILAAKERRARRLRGLCVFRETPIFSMASKSASTSSALYVSYSSAVRPSWFLSFDLQGRPMRALDVDHVGADHLGGDPVQQADRPECYDRFATGLYASTEWTGLVQRILNGSSTHH